MTPASKTAQWDHWDWKDEIVKCQTPTGWAPPSGVWDQGWKVAYYIWQEWGEHQASCLADVGKPCTCSLNDFLAFIGWETE